MYEVEFFFARRKLSCQKTSLRPPPQFRNHGYTPPTDSIRFNLTPRVPDTIHHITVLQSLNQKQISFDFSLRTITLLLPAAGKNRIECSGFNKIVASISNLFNVSVSSILQASVYSICLKSLVTMSTLILLSLIVAYHALQIQVRQRRYA